MNVFVKGNTRGEVGLDKDLEKKNPNSKTQNPKVKESRTKKKNPKSQIANWNS